MYDIVALGESLIDFTPAGINEMGMPLFSQNPGGAPANVLAMASKLGRSTAFVGKVGRDAFGRFLQEHMEKAGIDCSALRRDDRVPTTLAFVQLDEYGDRSFSFYRDPGADVMLRPEEVDDTLLEGCRIFHFGSVSLTKEPCRGTTLWVARRAREAGALISYDPNYRPFLWPSVEAARRALCAALELTDILKVSEEEMCLLTGESTLPGGAEKLQAMGPGQGGGVFPHTVRGGGSARLSRKRRGYHRGRRRLLGRPACADPRPGPDRTGGAHPGGVGIRHPCRQCCGRPDNNRQGRHSCHAGFSRHPGLCAGYGPLCFSRLILSEFCFAC